MGDWEVDIIIKRQHCRALVSLVERKSRFVRIAFVPHRTAVNVNREVICLMRPISDCVHTIMAGNGKEFAGHEQIASLLDADFYFIRPHVSWQRGNNENTTA